MYEDGEVIFLARKIWSKLINCVALRWVSRGCEHMAGCGFPRVYTGNRSRQEVDMIVTELRGAWVCCWLRGP